MTTYFKVLNLDGTPRHGGRGRWNIPPNGDTPGQWMRRIKNPVLCKRGYHLCRDTLDLLDWLGPTIYTAEAGGEVIVSKDKVVAETARLLRRLPWDESVARLFAADCAERVLPIFERTVPGDLRLRNAIEVARRYANGEASDIDLRNANRAARVAETAAMGTVAWAVARFVARVTTRDAGVVNSIPAAKAAAWAVMKDATGAEKAVWNVVYAAEREWQSSRLAACLLGKDEALPPTLTHLHRTIS